MIALDTNVLIRYLVHDDVEQTKAAHALLGSLTADDPGFICREAIIEIVEVLERSYRFSRRQIADILERLVITMELVVEAADDITQAIPAYRQGGTGFSDLMILAAAERTGARRLYTFNRSLARLKGVELVRTEHN